MRERNKLLLILGIFLMLYFTPFGNGRIQTALIEAFLMLQDYARHHILLCLVPAFFIAGAIANFISQGAVIKYLGDKANKFLAYGIASISGTILAVCSCTVLPLFAGIYKRGAGIGPAIAFLYSGPAINVLAIILTARILGFQLGVARAIGAVLFSIAIGFCMEFIFGKEDKTRLDNSTTNLIVSEETPIMPLWKTTIFFAVMVGILVFANWGKDESIAIWQKIYEMKWIITGILLLTLGIIIKSWFKKDQLSSWVESTWEFAKQILPLLLIGVFIAGFLLGRPGHESLIPSKWVEQLVGGNSLRANLFAAISGALMYFATLTEVPILQGLLGAGMGKGPALALLLAGPALSLPNMLVIRSIIGTKKTLTYVFLVVVMATLSGIIFGSLFS